MKSTIVSVLMLCSIVSAQVVTSNEFGRLRGNDRIRWYRSLGKTQDKVNNQHSSTSSMPVPLSRPLVASTVSSVAAQMWHMIIYMYFN
eukprot:scaffold72804_cov91-Cyclotella_meneghiniana.AAC.3